MKQSSTAVRTRRELGNPATYEDGASCIPFATPRFFRGVEQIQELACVLALIRQLAVEAFHTTTLGRRAGLNMNRLDLPLNGPCQVMARG